MTETYEQCFLILEMKFLALMNYTLIYYDSSSFGSSKGFDVNYSNFL